MTTRALDETLTKEQYAEMLDIHYRQQANAAAFRQAHTLFAAEAAAEDVVKSAKAMHAFWKARLDEHYEAMGLKERK